MGEIRLLFKLKNLGIDPIHIISEIESGITFRLFFDNEMAIFPQNYKTKWTKEYSFDKHCLQLTVSDEYFSKDTFFDQMFTSFLYNLMDFGSIKLHNIDFSKSIYRELIPETDFTFNNKIMLGTVLKPYFLEVDKKADLARGFIERGIKFVKEDETYLQGKETILKNALIIQQACGRDGFYIPNITSYTHDFSFIEELIGYSKISIVMVDFLVCGLGQVIKLKKAFPNICIWGHRIGYSPIEPYISMTALGKMAVTAGIDLLHIGTPTSEEMFFEKNDLIQEVNKTRRFKAIFTKTTPEIITKLINYFGQSALYMACGSFRNIDGASINWSKVEEWIAEVTKSNEENSKP